jgi:hypothetical protein
MACCGPSIQKAQNPEELLKKIRNFDNMEIKCELNNNKMTFKPNDGRWKTNFGLLPNPLIFEKKQEIYALEKTLEDKDKEIDNLEKTYLAKIAKLLVMTQVHCEIKTFIHEEFDRLGVSVKTKERERLIEDNDMSFQNNDENQKDVISDNYENNDNNEDLIENNNNNNNIQQSEKILEPA